MSDDGTMRSWIMARIREALDQVDLARATASDLDDHIVLTATIQLAEDLEAFALRLAARLCEMSEGPDGGDGVQRHRRCPA
jgi:hypothetical protein